MIVCSCFFIVHARHSLKTLLLLYCIEHAANEQPGSKPQPSWAASDAGGHKLTSFSQSLTGPMLAALQVRMKRLEATRLEVEQQASH